MATGSTGPAVNVAAAIEAIARGDRGRILSNLIGEIRDFQLAEDSLQDAMEVALAHWARNGLPASPQGWIMQTARRKAIDRLRRASNFRSKAADIAHMIAIENHGAEEVQMDAIGDERLKLIFTCCHPALDKKTCVALTLRSVCGLTTEEIADAYLDSHDAMAQRLVRARHKIAKAGIAYEVPEQTGWPERLESVLAVVYLIFNEGYASGGASHIRPELCEEAIRLARLLVTLLPGEAEVEGLLALMLLHHARRAARLATSGEIISLENQDRRRWDGIATDEGVALVERALSRSRAGPYQLQAAIVAIHAHARSFAETDWQEIAALYETLAGMTRNPVHELNRAVAISYAENAERALAMLSTLSQALAQYQPFYAVTADLLARAGRLEEARAAYRSAISLSQSNAERLFLVAKLDALC